MIPKYRAWDGVEMFEVDAIIFDGAVFDAFPYPHIMDSHNDVHKLSDIKLMWPTGLKDKNGKATLQWANISGKHLRRRDDWLVLCVSCHRYFDKPWMKRRASA